MDFFSESGVLGLNQILEVWSVLLALGFRQVCEVHVDIEQCGQSQHVYKELSHDRFPSYRTRMWKFGVV